MTFLLLVSAFLPLAALYGLLFIPDMTTELAWLVMLDGLIGGIILWGSVIYLWPSRIFSPLRRLAFPGRILALIALVVVCIPLTASITASLYARKVVIALDYGNGWSLFLYISAMTALSLIIVQVAQVIGPRVLASMLVGRYHTPKEERRIFLFVDLVGSTALTKQLGDLGFQRFLTRFFFDIGRPISDHFGEIHAYVGDEVIVTWPFKTGARNARCVRCFFAIKHVLDRNGSIYEKRFGVKPQIRAGLHGGEVIISECGDTKKSIVYFGDTVNTAARLEGEAKRLSRSLVASDDVLAALDLPADYGVEFVEDVILRGHDSPTRIASITAAPTPV